MTEANYVENSLITLERSLKETLNPVKPDKQFVSDLKRQLINQPINREEQRTAISLLLIAAGLFSGLVVFLLGRRFFESKRHD